MDHQPPGAAAGRPGPLTGVTVLDLSRALAGPYATALLADMGATVIKVESIKGGDSTRSWPPFENEHSLYFDCTNRGKSSLALDFYSEDGKALLRSLALQADVLVENFRPGVLAEIDLDPEELRTQKPDLIIASVSGFGTTGPLSRTAGLDQVAQGMSGLMSVTGADADNMFRVGLPVVDIYAGVFIAFGISSALAGKQSTGTGMEVSTSLLESALAVSAFQSQRYLSTGEVPEPQGNNHPVLSPYGVFKTADIPIIIAVGNDKQWQQLCGLLGEPSLAVDAEYRTGRDRAQNRDALTSRIEQLLAARSGLDWIEDFRAAKIPTGPIYNYRQVFEDRQVKALDMVRTVQRSDGSKLPLLRGPLSINGEATPVRKAPPALGEDTRKILQGLQLSHQEIDDLIQAGVVGEANVSAGALT